MQEDPAKEFADAFMKPSASVLTVVVLITDELLAAGHLSAPLLRGQLRRAARQLGDEDIGTRKTLLRVADHFRGSERSRKAKRIR